MPNMVTSRLKGIMGRYNAQYWTVITLELLERGAYYGIMGYFPVHMIRNVGITGTQYGIMYALLLSLLYTLPLISSSLARKFGYKKILLLAFILLAPSYLAMTFLNSFWMFIPLIITWGVGAGAFKPMVSATIAHVTVPENRNSAYSIYYLSINWGSLIAMVMIGFFIPQAFAHIAFMVGAVLITVNLLITFLFYKDPVEKDTSENVFSSLKRMVLVMRDTKFAVLILIYAGFFFIFSSMHTFLPVYYVDFGIKPWESFEAPLMSAFNPLTIVLLGPFLSRYMDRFDSLKLMIFGMFIFSGGLLLLGMIPIWYMMLIGIVIFSIGEFVTHPNFISYVSRIAPKDKVALYMGYAFIPSAIGNVSGSLAGGVMWDNIAVAQERPSLFWTIYVAIGLFTIGNFLLYNKWIKGGRTTTGERRTVWNSRASVIGVYSLVGVMIVLGLSSGTTTFIGGEDSEEGRGTYQWEESSVTVSFSEENLAEGDSTIYPVEIPYPNIVRINITLTWSDEDDIQRLVRTYRNEPDTFLLGVEMSNMTEVSETAANEHGSEGVIGISLLFDPVEDPFDEESFLHTGMYNITVSMMDAGNYNNRFSLMGFNDPGNGYRLVIEYRYLALLD
ncbi:hypothetical protein B6U90_00150 [Thermoplasmatales archaeon ex4484_6]|nr:MAG: hypothetical protein B6U90_00150 [Thermoplasmatales archaeon ex4484_6]